MKGAIMRIYMSPRTKSKESIYFGDWLDDDVKILLAQAAEHHKKKLINLTEPRAMKLFEKLKLEKKENETLDFKELYELNEKKTAFSNHAKKELKKDICSFANFRGGHIFVGVRQQKDDIELVGIVNSEFYNQQFFDQILSDGTITPPIQGVTINKITYNEKHSFLT